MVRLAATLIESNKWYLNATDINAAFLQRKKIDRRAIIKQPQAKPIRFGSQTNVYVVQPMHQDPST